MTLPFWTYRVAVTLPAKSGIPADETQNTFHFYFGTVPTDTDMTNLVTDIKNFYTTIASGASYALTALLAPRLDVGTNKCRCEFYLLPDDAPAPSGPPAAIKMFTLGTTGSTGLPNESAVALTILGAGYDTVPEFSGSTRPRARRRGRIYIGP